MHSTLNTSMAWSASSKVLRSSLATVLTSSPLNASALAVGGTFFFTLILWISSKRKAGVSSLNSLPGPTSPSLLFGHLPQLFDKKHGLEFHDNLTVTYGRTIRLKGLFGADLLYISDPRALSTVMNGEEYHEHPSHIVCCLLAFGPGLLASHGDQHKKLRRMLNPVFSAAHMVRLVPVFRTVAEKLRDKLLEYIQSRETPGKESDIDVLEWVSRTALELIGQGGLGYSFRALDHKEDAYGDAAKQLLPAYAPFRLGLLLLPTLNFHSLTAFMPALQRKIVNVIPVPAVQRLKCVIDTITHTTTDILEEQLTALASQSEAHDSTQDRKDIMSSIMDANSKASAEARLEEPEIRAIISELVFSAHDTTSGSISRTLSILASRPDIQSQVRAEIHAAKQSGIELDFAAIDSLKLLDAICKETLRLHPPVTVEPRIPVEDVIIPVGSKQDAIHVPKGTLIFCAIRPVNRDTKIWGDDALEWIPERWLRPLPSSVAEAHLPGVFSSLMTFFGGKRACIGYRFAILEMKVVLFTLLDTFEFRPGSVSVEWAFGMTLSPHPAGKEAPGMPLKVKPVENLS